MDQFDTIGKLILKAKQIAIEYRKITGKPLGITGEVAEFEAADKLNLELCVARQPGYDAIRDRDGLQERIQIKGRILAADGKPGQRVSSIRFNHEWDFVILVLLDEQFNPFEMYEANRESIKEALSKPGSKARTERGALSVSKFKSISKVVWSK